jgi:hypothetical protein
LNFISFFVLVKKRFFVEFLRGQHKKCLDLQNTANRRSVELHYSVIEKQFRDRECKQKDNIMFKCSWFFSSMAATPRTPLLLTGAKEPGRSSSPQHRRLAAGGEEPQWMESHGRTSLIGSSSSP